MLICQNKKSSIYAVCKRMRKYEIIKFLLKKFNAEVMLYMAFVAIANYTQANYELGYALKFMRILTLLLTNWFGLWGYIGGIVICLAAIVTNRTVSEKSYIYPLLPLHFRQLCKRLFRLRLPDARK